MALAGTSGGATEGASSAGAPVGLWPLTFYFLRLGALGFGGVALVGMMHRDLVERRRLVAEPEFKFAVALAQIMPGPLAAQVAIALGYFQTGLVGAIAAGLAFVLPSFVIVVGLAALYVAYGGLWWVQALSYSIAAAVVAIIAVAAYRLARATNKRDPLMWGIFAGLLVVTAWVRAELAEFFIMAGLLVLVVRARPRWLDIRLPFLALPAGSLVLSTAPMVVQVAPDALVQMGLFFAKAGAFVFGSGLAIVPFLYQGVVQQFGWLSEQQFLDAVAIAMITPGPVLITVAFIGYLVAGLPGAAVSAFAIFSPVYFLTILPAPWLRRHRDNAQLKAFVDGATAAATGAIAGA
ncbi:MAG: chromate efflux transporter, partial [Chloroflexi bacterium]|nr:chromate efflux transporter [Chloroflexota bacterium]